MQISKQVFAYGEKSKSYTRAELKALLDLIKFDINDYFLSDEQIAVFQNSNDREKLEKLKKLLIENYNQDIRKEIALEMERQLEKQEGQNRQNFLLKGVFLELNKILNSICLCLLGNLGNEAIETMMVEDSNNYNFFEKILFMFKSEHSKEIEAIRNSGLFTEKEIKAMTHKTKSKSVELVLE